MASIQTTTPKTQATSSTLPPDPPSQIHFSNPAPSHLDFRSDTITTPTSSMLNSIQHATCFDDVFAEDPTTQALESLLVNLTGHEAALLVLSGTMGNQLALRTHFSRPPHAVLCDARAHILTSEAGGTAAANGAMVQGVHPSNGLYLTLEDVISHAVLDDEIHGTPTRIISLENTLGGTIMPLSEAKRISQFARQNNIALHLDGARIWEAVAAGQTAPTTFSNGTLSEWCTLFDSASLCFSKGLGAPLGSILVSNKSFIKHARWLRKSIGGGMRQTGLIAAPATVAVQETFLGGKLQATHVRAKQIEQVWTGMGGKVTLPVETNMVWLDLASAGVDKGEWIRICSEQGVKVLGGRIVVHYQIGDEAVERLSRAMVRVLEGRERA